MDSKRLTAIITVVSTFALVTLMIIGMMPVTVVDWRGGTLLLLVFGGIMLNAIEPASVPDKGLWSRVSVALTITAIIVGTLNLTFGGEMLFLFLFFSLVALWLIMFTTSITHRYRRH